MANVQETIPEALRPEVDAALAWWNAREGVPFEVTGIVDPPEGRADGARDLQLILCGGDRCERREFRVAPSGSDFAVSIVDEEPAVGEAGLAPELDPPPGARRSWLDQQLAQHAFIVLVFYRGFW